MATANRQVLQAIAEEEVRRTFAGLPEELRARSLSIPVVYDSRSLRELDRDDLTDTLGLFVGENLLEAGQGSGGLPAQIILYLTNIWFEADNDEAVYRKEVRATLLHELGHYLGLDETDLQERGL
jgi:predicted Zn-dependent protease with MMP-like domain